MGWKGLWGPLPNVTPQLPVREEGLRLGATLYLKTIQI